MKNILLIISLFAICVGVKGQTMKGDVRPEVLIETTMGNIRVELYNETPLHRDNFLKLIREDHFYDSLLFHRVIPDFMIQGGDPSSKNAPKGQCSASIHWATPCRPRSVCLRFSISVVRWRQPANPMMSIRSMSRAVRSFISSTADGRARRDCSGDVRIWKNSSATVSG